MANSSRDEVALAGPDGNRAAALLSAAKDHGTALLSDLTGRAVARLLTNGGSRGAISAPVLFDDAELAQLAGSLANTIATADLLGRARVHGWRQVAEKRVKKFSESDDPFASFADPIPPAPPRLAVDYFRRLVPTLGLDPHRYGPLLDRHAFTLAVAADQVILEKVKEAIAARLEGRAEPGTATNEVQEILDAAGVSPKNPAYSEMVYRTNMMDAYNQGATAELQSPEMQEFFPVWKYEGILDSRTGDDHRPKIGRYYPVSAAFAEVRGPRVFSCRCSFTPVSKYDAAKVRVETTW